MCTPLNLAVLTVSDTRNLATDTSGAYLCEALQADGHKLYERVLCSDDCYQIRKHISRWIADAHVHAVLITGGTGFYGRDNTPEAVTPLLDTLIPGFGELFRSLSYQEIGTATLQSRALAGLANRTAVFCLPGSTGACKTGWDQIIRAQLDSSTRPCNMVTHLGKL